MTELNETIKKYENLIDIVINRYFPYKKDDEDIKQIGRIAIWKALKTYNKKNSKIETYLTAAIKYRIINEIKRENRIKNKLNILSNVISLDEEIEDDETEKSLHEAIAGDNDIEYVDWREFTKSLDETEIKIIQLKQRQYTDSKIKAMMNLGRRKYEKKLKGLKKRLKDNVL